MATEEVQEKLPAGKVLAKVADSVYQDGRDAKERGELVAWTASNFPCEIAATFGLRTVYPESQCAAISAKGGSLPLLEHAEGELGYSNDLCAYARINQAYADLGKCPNGEMEMPLPDIVLCCNNICNCMVKWYENLAERLNVPIVMIDIPFLDSYEMDQKRIDYIKGQFMDAIHQLEEITGKKWDEEKFKEVCEYCNHTSKSWLEATKCMEFKPSPLNGFELFNHMAVATMGRAQEGAAEAMDDLLAEYRQNVAEGKSSFRTEEKYRVMFEGIACWPYLRATSKPLKEAGVNVTACVYGPSFAFEYSNLDELAAAYCSMPNATNLERSVELREELCREGKVDGGLIHINRSCKMWSGFALELGRRIGEDLDIPIAYFDGDQSDPRNFSEEQYKTRVEGLVEIMASKKGE